MTRQRDYVCAFGELCAVSCPAGLKTVVIDGDLRPAFEKSLVPDGPHHYSYSYESKYSEEGVYRLSRMRYLDSQAGRSGKHASNSFTSLASYLPGISAVEELIQGLVVQAFP